LSNFRSLSASVVWGFFALAAVGQAQNITIVSGNGQVSCPLCTIQSSLGLQTFDGMYVKVTDANGNPLAGAQVNWAIAQGQGVLASNGGVTDTTVTDSTGVTYETYLPVNQISGTVGIPFVQDTVTASLANGNSATFYGTTALANLTNSNNSPNQVFVSVLTPNSFPPCASCIFPGDKMTGSAGSTSSTQFVVQVYAPASAQPQVPNVSVRLVPVATSDNPNPPSAISCATQAGADPGSVLTDQTGSATCTPILGSLTGTSQFYILVGGVASRGYNQGNAAQGYFASGAYTLTVTPGLPNSLSIVTGNNQTATPGQSVTSPLVAVVADPAGNLLSGQSVTWTVSPSGAATLSNTTTTTDSNGRVQTNVTLANNATGTISVKAALASNPNISATFTVTANVQLTGIQAISGNNQSAVINTAFSAPLVVQVSASNGQSAANTNVNFSVSGPATLSTSVATTNSQGQAQVSVTALGTPGAVTVTATAGTQTTTFNLTVVPQGPQFTSANVYNGADFQVGSISPCSIATIIAPGVAAAIQGTAGYIGVGALPFTLGGDTVTVAGAQAPLFNVSNQNGQQQVTFQVPCSVTPGPAAIVVNVGGGSGSANVIVKAASPGLFMTRYSTTVIIPVLERPDGSFVGPTNPAHKGETLIAYVTGLGPTAPSIATNALPAPGSTPTIQGQIIPGLNGNGAPFMSAAVSTDLIGVQTVSFVVPSNTVSGNATFSIGVLYPAGGSSVFYSNVGVFPVQ
jgi:uncharacterized protein (TIGR03437 family)